MKDKFTGEEISGQSSVLVTEGGDDGIYHVTRTGAWVSLVIALFGHSYAGNNRFHVKLGDGDWFTNERGSTVYTVVNGKIKERVDLPLFAFGHLDRRVRRIHGPTV